MSRTKKWFINLSFDFQNGNSFLVEVIFQIEISMEVIAQKMELIALFGILAQLLRKELFAAHL